MDLWSEGQVVSCRKNLVQDLQDDCRLIFSKKNKVGIHYFRTVGTGSDCSMRVNKNINRSLTNIQWIERKKNHEWRVQGSIKLHSLSSFNEKWYYCPKSWLVFISIRQHIIISIVQPQLGQRQQSSSSAAAHMLFCWILEHTKFII